MPDRIFQFSTWATLVPPAGWVIDTGRFLGNPTNDLLGYLPRDGSLWVGANDGDHPEIPRSTQCLPVPRS